jgi:putative spermidine/putrescine transport system substrate-binding protein
MSGHTVLSRRDLLTYAAAGAGLVAYGDIPGLAEAAAAKQGTVTLADIGVGDPGTWAPFTNPTGWSVRLVSIGNAPATILSVLIRGGGTRVYDIANIVGGMQQPLVQNNLIEPIDTSRLPNWSTDTFIRRYLTRETPGFNFIGYKGTVYGVPTVLQGDSFAFLPEKTGHLDSYGALFDPKWRGYVALEDNFTTAGQKTALYLKTSGRAQIANPANMTPGEIKTTVDFLIKMKKRGQFRTLWTSFSDAVHLLTSREVYVLDCWEPMVIAANKAGAKTVYARPKEGFLLWAMAAYVTRNPSRSAHQTLGVYALLNFMLGGWYGAKITLLRGYMTNPAAARYAASHPHEFTPAEARQVAAIQRRVQAKFEAGGTWQNRWPTHLTVYEEEWARFKAAPGG